MKRFLRFDKKEQGYYSFEDILNKFDRYIYNLSFRLEKSLEHSSESYNFRYISYEDIRQELLITLYNKYLSYDNESSTFFVSYVITYLKLKCKQIYGKVTKCYQVYKPLNFNYVPLDKTDERYKEPIGASLTSVLHCESYNVEEAVINNMTFSDAFSELNKECQKTFILKCYLGYSVESISKAHSITEIGVYKRLKTIKDVFSKHYGVNYKKEKITVDKVVNHFKDKPYTVFEVKKLANKLNHSYSSVQNFIADNKLRDRLKIAE